MAETALDGREVIGSRQQEDEDLIERAGLSDAKRPEDARRWFNHLIETEKLEYTSAALRLGLEKEPGRNLVSKFCRDKFDPQTDGAQIARMVLLIEALRAQREGPEGITEFIGFQETRSCQMLWHHLDAARNGHFIGVAVGPMGFGKTEAIREAERRRRRDGKPPIEYLYCRVSTNLPALINEVAEVMGLIERGGAGDPARLHRKIAQSLQSRPLFLVFDEADYLNNRCLDFIRNLHDETGAGMFLAGRPSLLRNIHAGIHWSTTNGDGPIRAVMEGALAPFADRIFISILPGLGEEEVGDIAESALKGELTDAARTKLLFYVGPNFRLLRNLIIKLRDVRLKAGKKIEEEMVNHAWRKLQRPDLRR